MAWDGVLVENQSSFRLTTRAPQITITPGLFGQAKKGDRAECSAGFIWAGESALVEVPMRLSGKLS